MESPSKKLASSKIVNFFHTYQVRNNIENKAMLKDMIFNPNSISNHPSPNNHLLLTKPHFIKRPKTHSSVRSNPRNISKVSFKQDVPFLSSDSPQNCNYTIIPPIESKNGKKYGKSYNVIRNNESNSGGRMIFNKKFNGDKIPNLTSELTKNPSIIPNQKSYTYSSSKINSGFKLGDHGFRTPKQNTNSKLVESISYEKVRKSPNHNYASSFRIIYSLLTFLKCWLFKKYAKWRRFDLYFIKNAFHNKPLHRISPDSTLPYYSCYFLVSKFLGPEYLELFNQEMDKRKCILIDYHWFVEWYLDNITFVNTLSYLLTYVRFKKSVYMLVQQIPNLNDQPEKPVNFYHMISYTFSDCSRNPLLLLRVFSNGNYFDYNLFKFTVINLNGNIDPQLDDFLLHRFGEMNHPEYFRLRIFKQFYLRQIQNGPRFGFLYNKSLDSEHELMIMPSHKYVDHYVRNNSISFSEYDEMVENISCQNSSDKRLYPRSDSKRLFNIVCPSKVKPLQFINREIYYHKKKPLNIAVKPTLIQQEIDQYLDTKSKCDLVNHSLLAQSKCNLERTLDKLDGNLNHKLETSINKIIQFDRSDRDRSSSDDTTDDRKSMFSIHNIMREKIKECQEDTNILQNIDRNI